MADSAIKSISLYPLSIPFRHKVAHAVAQRLTSDSVAVAIELNSHVVGYGETLPRPYVTGETVESVIATIRRVHLDHLVNLRPERFAAALEAIEQLPWRDGDGSLRPAARAAVELALLDAYSRHFQRPIHDAVGWMDLHEFGGRSSIAAVRCAGVVPLGDPRRPMRTLRLLWWAGMRDFKLKVGDQGDDERVRRAARYLAKPIRDGRATLRLDANGAWRIEEAVERLTAWRDIPLALVEQPLPRGCEELLSELRARTAFALMHDESLVTMEDAERLTALGAGGAFNIRVSKCGGFLPSLRLAQYARRNGFAMQLGCMVGETSVLSAVARRFLELVPDVRFVEGNFGTLLLTTDVCRRPLRFGYGGRLKALNGLGWGVEVDAARLAALTLDAVQRIEL